MRFPLRATAVALSVVTLLGAGTLAASVSASAGEGAVSSQVATGVPVPVAVPAGAPAVEPVGATPTVDATAGLMSAAHARLMHDRAVASALVAKQAKGQRVQKLRDRIIAVARNQIGDRYSAGMSGPSAFDCSGFTRYVYKVATGKELPHYSRAQYDRVKRIPLKQARPGDLVFFLRNGAHHVGIYLGKGRMVDAAGYGKGVKISPISGSWWSRTYTGVGSLLPS